MNENKEQAIFYVYQYVTPDGVPYYIGKGKNNRINAKHVRTTVPPEEFRLIIQSNLLEADALLLEHTLIKLYGRKVDGGLLDNTKLNRWACMSGWTHSEDTKQRISKSTSGKLKSESHKQNMRKPKSEEHKQKIREANLGRKRDGRYEKISAARKGVPWSAARRAAQEARKGQIDDMA